MLCFLCLRQEVGEKSESLLKIATEKDGTDLSIDQIIDMHLGSVLTHKRKTRGRKVCRECRNALRDFHSFFKFISNIHGSSKFERSLDWPSESLSPTYGSCDQDFNYNINPNDEVKVEVAKLDHLPEVKIIESEDTIDVIEITPPLKPGGCDVRSSTDLVQGAFEEDYENAASINIDTTGSVEDYSQHTSPSDNQYALLPKRVVVRPKKYNKAKKDHRAHPVRLPADELLRRKHQQEQFDKIILDFFGGKLLCTSCGLYVLNFGDMLRHYRVAHETCPGYVLCCGRKFSQRKALAEHVLVHRNPEQFKCNTCSKILKNSRLLQAHELSHSQTILSQKTTFACDKCSKSFFSKATFDYHVLSKHVPKSELKYSCPKCNKKLLTERKLQNHLKCSHDPERAIICDKCGKEMRSNHSLKKHLELMHSEKPRPDPVMMQCKVCDVWLKNETGLKQHIKSIHLDSAGEHRCQICSKVSPNARALRRHIYHNHECERKFKCTMCEKAFKRPQELREHTSTHTGEVLYTCTNCSMTFFCSANLYKHRQRLHREQYEADKKLQRPPNILRQAVGATAALKFKFKKVS